MRLRKHSHSDFLFAYEIIIYSVLISGGTENEEDLYLYLIVADVQIFVGTATDQVVLGGAWQRLQGPRFGDLAILLITRQKAQRFPDFLLVEVEVLHVFGQKRTFARCLCSAFLSAVRHHAFVNLVAERNHQHSSRTRSGKGQVY